VSDTRKRIKDPAPNGWQEVAAAVREVRDQIRESFGPRQEVRLAVPDGVDAERMAKDLLEAMDDPDATTPHVITGDPETLAAIQRVQFETREQRLKREIRDRLLDLCGFMDGGEVTAEGSASNDLAHERADVIMRMIDPVRKAGYPEAIPVPPEGAPLRQMLDVLRPLLYRIVNATAAPGEELTEHVDVIMAFVDLAREHQDPKRLLPRGDRLGDWLPPGTPVVVHLGGFEHPAVVEPTRDTVTVRLTKAGVVTEYPRDLISKEGEPWMPPKRTAS
jgi:hypothetical protein